MADILNQICTKRLTAVEYMKVEHPLSAIREAAEAQKGKQRGFIRALSEYHGPAIISEIKRASPSAGLIREQDFHPHHLAQTLEQAGAAALSVLTEPDWFDGHLDHMQAARAACTIPVLRKDFIIDEWQVYETASSGADCLLLIVAALTRQQLHDYHALALELGLDILVEIHTMEELERAASIESLALIGVNNRNLKTLEIDVAMSQSLFPMLPKGVLAVSESGISTPETLFKLYTQGYQAFLVGHALMQDESPEQALSTLLGRK